MDENGQVEKLKALIIARLQTVIDPETGADVVRMRLIEGLTVNLEGEVAYTFRPSSPLCPIAVFLVKEIKQAVSAVPGVTMQQITVANYVAADELTKLINQEN
jgi:metal-sulfur cluster biosynthetic enzyme